MRLEKFLKIMKKVDIGCHVSFGIMKSEKERCR